MPPALRVGPQAALVTATPLSFASGTAFFHAAGR